MEQSIYILQFKSGGELEDIIVYTDRDKAFEALKANWKNKSLLEYEVNNCVSEMFTYVHICSEDGVFTRYR